MIDLQVIEIRDILPVKRLEIAHGVEPRSVYVRGVDMRSAREVWLNEYKSPDIVVIDNKTVLAQVPAAVDGGPLRSVTVVSSKLTQADRSRIEFRIGDSPRFISGIERLIQVFLKLLLQTPGTDAFAPDLGGGILRAAGRLSRSPTAGANTLVADVEVGVGRTSKQLLSLQAHEPALALTEKLLYARLLEARFSATDQTLYAIIDLANQAMQSSVVSLEV
jgi:hypothetical protein